MFKNHLLGIKIAILEITSVIWIAISRVGARTKDCGALISNLNDSKITTENTNVLPVPDLAWTIKSIKKIVW